MGSADNGVQPDANRVFRRLFLIIPVSAGATVLFMLVLSGSGSFAGLLRVDPCAVAISLFLAITPWFTDAARTAVWARFLGRPVPYGRLLRIAATAELGAAIAPPAIGTVPVRTVLLAREGFSSGEALSLTTLASIEDWVFYLIAAPFCLMAADARVVADLWTAVHRAGRIALWIVPTAAVVVAAGFLFLRGRAKAENGAAPHRLLERTVRWCRATADDLSGVFRTVVRNGAGPFLLTLCITAVQWGCRYSVATVLARSLGLPADPTLFFALQVILYGCTTIIPTPGGSGGAEALFALLHRPYLPGPLLGVVTAAWRVSTFYIPVLVASVVALAPVSAERGRRTEPSGDRHSLPQPEL